MKKLLKLMVIASITIAFSMAIAFLPNSALADTTNPSTANSAQQAAQEVVKQTGVKEQFGKSRNGEQLLDNAQEKASEKLDDLAKEADSGEKLPESKKLFLKNLQNQ